MKSFASGLWAQDRLEVRPNLTITYGLRWDFVVTITTIDGGYSTLPSSVTSGAPSVEPSSPGASGRAESPIKARCMPTTRPRESVTRHRARWAPISKTNPRQIRRHQ